MAATSSRSGAKPFSKRVAVAPFQRGLHAKVDPIRHLLDKGLIIDSPDIGSHKLPDGRYQLYLKNAIFGGTGAAAATTPPTPQPSAGGTYTEFYCQSGGSNLNAGSTTANSAVYTSTNGNWTSGTRVFVPTDGSTPANSISVGDFVSVFLDAATVSVYVARVTSVAAGVNGAITVDNSATAGTAPTTAATGRTLKAGGAWKGPNAASGFPITLNPAIDRLKNVAGNVVRLNMKNDATYSVTATISPAIATMMVQGYTTDPGDGGFATIDNGTTATSLLLTSNNGTFYADLIFSTSATTGSAQLVIDSARSNWLRCIFHGAMGDGLNFSSGVLIECEAYACNKSNTANNAGFTPTTAGWSAIRCYSHDHTGSNTAGFCVQAPGHMIGCIVDTCAGKGLLTTSFSGPLIIDACDFYNNASDAINLISTVSGSVLIENCNFIKNTGAAINNASATTTGFVFNCGYGSGTQANGSADTLKGLQQSGTILYGSGVTPYTAPSTGNFTITQTDAIATGLGTFTETGSSKSGTVGTPNIGAA